MSGFWLCAIWIRGWHRQWNRHHTIYFIYFVSCYLPWHSTCYCSIESVYEKNAAAIVLESYSYCDVALYSPLMCVRYCIFRFVLLLILLRVSTLTPLLIWDFCPPVCPSISSTLVLIIITIIITHFYSVVRSLQRRLQQHRKTNIVILLLA